MIEVQMSDDIRKFQNKSVGPFTTRQVISIIAGACIAIPVFFLLPIDDITLKAIPSLVIASPIFMIGWLSMDGCPAEMIALRYLYSKYLAPPRRKAISENPYSEELKKMKKQKIMDKNNGKMPKEVIKYSSKTKYKVYQ